LGAGPRDLRDLRRVGILYESFIHPLTILSGLPSAGFRALLTLLVSARLNIYRSSA